MLGITDIAHGKLQLMERHDGQPLTILGQLYLGCNTYITWSVASNIPCHIPSPLTCTNGTKCVLLSQRHRKFAVH